MARDDETGADPVSTDGDPSADELERRRQARGANGGSVKDRAAEAEPPEEGEEEDGQFAMGLIEADGPVSLSRLIPRGTPVEVTVSMDSAEVPGKGLFGMDEDVILVVRCRPRKYEPVPIRQEGDKTTRVKFRQCLKPLYAARAGTEHARAMMGEAEAKAQAAGS